MFAVAVSVGPSPRMIHVSDDEPQPLDLAEAAAAEFKTWHGTPFPGLFLRATDLGERGFGVEAWQRLPSSCEDAPTVNWAYGYIRPPYGGSNA